MRQFDIFRNPSAASRGFAPFVVAIKSHYIALGTVLVAPLVNDTSFFPSICAANPTLTIIAKALRAAGHLVARLGKASASFPR